MASLIEDYALLSDMNTGALVSRDGSIDWFCAPRFDSRALFAALLGEADHGRWLLAPLASLDPQEGQEIRSQRSYRQNTFILQTIWQVGEASVRVTEFMPLTDGPSILRKVDGLTGEVTMYQELALRFDYGKTIPWVTHYQGSNPDGQPDTSADMLVGLAGPHALVFRGDDIPQGDPQSKSHSFTVSAGQSYVFSLSYFPSNQNPPEPADYSSVLNYTQDQWTQWADLSKGTNSEEEDPTQGRYRQAKTRSLLLLRSLISRETGALVASTTTSLPEVIGGKRNFDLRFAWLRDAALALEVSLAQGHEREAAQLRNWLLRALANNSRRVHSVYGLAGQRDDMERRLALPGYEGSQPVRVGNGSGEEFQGDALGQVLLAFSHLRQQGVAEDHLSWPLQQALLNAATERIGEPDRSIWENFGDPAVYTHSQAMLWAAFDAGVSAVEDFGLEGDAATWAHCRDALAQDIFTRGFNQDLGCFVSTYGGSRVDSSLLQLAQIGLVAWDDPRMLATVQQIEQTISHPSGMIYRYDNSQGQDGFEDQGQPHFVSSLWLAEQYLRSGRVQEGQALLDRVLDCANDLGLMGVGYSFEEERMTGNFPQALAHICLIRVLDALGV